MITKTNLLISAAVVMGVLFVGQTGAKAAIEDTIINKIVSAATQPAELAKICGAGKPSIEELDGVACHNKIVAAFAQKMCPTAAPTYAASKCATNAAAALGGQAPNDVMDALIKENTLPKMSAENQAVVKAATVVKNLP